MRWMDMKTSKRGVDFIKGFESCRLSAYKALPTEEYYTIGYGHYGKDVMANMQITLREAEEILKSDLNRFEVAVTKTGLKLNQNQFDALVSFAFNCGEGNLKQLVKNRTLDQIADAILLYNNSGKQVIAGLVRRRKAEREMFLDGHKSIDEMAQEVLDDKWGTGAERMQRLTDEGYDYRAIQARVNQIIKERGTK